MPARHLAIPLVLALLLALAVTLILAAPVAHARTKVDVGIGDQSAAMFLHPDFAKLKVRKSRYFVRWDAIRHRDALARVDEWVAIARAHRVRPFVHISTDDLRHKRAKLPSKRAYQRHVGRLVRHLRKRGVRDFGVWNEANHKSQPTWRNPARAAAYYRLMRRMCRRCTIVGLDVLDQRGVGRYIRRWFRALPRGLRHRKVVVGIHNYSDTNRKRSRGTRTIIQATRRQNRRARFWLTETGGVVNFGRSFPCNPARAASRLGYMFRLARRYDRYVQRLYSYNWFGSNCRGFDAGLTNADGTLRPGYAVFRGRLRGFTR